MLQMPELVEISDKIEREVSDLREKAGAAQWGKLSRRGFIFNITNVLPGLEELYSVFQIARMEMSKGNDSAAPEVSDHLANLNKLITTLKRNREMEESRLEKMKAQGIEAIAQTVTVPELYAELEQKTLAMLLKSNYLVERIRIFGRRKEPAMQTKASQRNVLDLLAKREEEVAALRKKYEETRKNTFLGLLEKDTSAEIENELNEVSRSVESRTALMRKAFDAAKMFYEQFSRQQVELEQRVLAAEELQAQMTAKTFEVITMLKKERDYAKKMLIEIEQETIQLRNTYSKELLGMQEEKLHIKNTFEQRHEREATELRNELRHKADLLRHFQESAAAREKKIAELEQENEKLWVLTKTLHKHQAMREKILGEKAPETGISAPKKKGKPRKGTN